jgi:phage regulator Rha-like protein
MSDLIVVEINGENRIDSRVLATNLDYEHKVILQSIRRHKDRLEAKSVLLHFEAKPLKGSAGGRPESYYMLDERQCLILAGSLKKGKEADEWHDFLVDAFLTARNRVKELESRQPSKEEQIFTKDVQQRCIRNEKLLPPGYWCVVTEMWREAWTLEAFQKELKPTSVPDGSCGTKWRNYLKSIEHPLLSKSKKACLHVPNLKNRVEVWIYSDDLLSEFRSWIRATYADYYVISYSPTRLIGAEQIDKPKKQGWLR